MIRQWMALLLAGGVFLCGIGRVKKGVVVDGVPVGGLSFQEAAERVREKREETPFTVHTPAGDTLFRLSYSDDLDNLLKKAKRGEELTSTVRADWVNAEEELLSLCRTFAKEPVSAELFFSEEGFFYREGEDGAACSFDALLDDVWDALRKGKNEATLSVFPVPPKVTVETLKKRTRLLASFSTTYDENRSNRAHNIALAVSRITGKILQPEEEFSFNEVVGKRTAENGFEEAPVISGGEMMMGTGGGVCQASTTLMNAALRAGLKVTESHPHSLSVGYVPPSLDAMVSEYSDLRFVNPYSVPVYLLGKAEGGRITFSVYGLPDGKTYRTESVVLLRVDPPPEKIVEGEEDRVLRAAKQGIASESFLLVYEGNTLLSRTRLRRDVYAVVQGIRETKAPSANFFENEGKID